MLRNGCEKVICISHGEGLSFDPRGQSEWSYTYRSTLLKMQWLRNTFDKYLQMAIDGPWNQLVFLTPQTPHSLLISYAFACGCCFVTCLAWGSASLGHSHSPELKSTEKLINTQAPYKGLVLNSLAQPHICICLGPPGPPYILTHLGRITASLKKYPPEGYPSRLWYKGRTAGLNSSVSSCFMSVSNQTTSWANYLLIGTLVVGTFWPSEKTSTAKWTLSEHMAHLTIY